MTNDPATYELPQREPRVEMKDGRRAGVTVQRSTSCGTDVLLGKLLDISRGGAKVSVPCCIPFGESIRLTIDVPELKFQFVAPADVSWSRKDKGGLWLVGCCFDPGLPDDVVDRLAVAGYLERRRNPRYPIGVEGTVCWELTQTLATVTLEDFSVDGFSIMCTEPGEPGQRLRLQVEKPDGKEVSISAKMQWKAQTLEGFLVGCSFLNAHDHHHLWEIAYAGSTPHALSSRKSSSQARWTPLWFAALLAFVLMYPVLVPLLTIGQGPRRAEEPKDESAPPAVTTQKNGPATPESVVHASAQQTAAPAQASRSTSIDEQRQHEKETELAKQAKNLRIEAARLASQQEQLRQQQQQWQDRMEKRSAKLDTQEQALLVARAAWQVKQRQLDAEISARAAELDARLAQLDQQHAAPARQSHLGHAATQTPKDQNSFQSNQVPPASKTPKDQTATQPPQDQNPFQSNQGPPASKTPQSQTATQPPQDQNPFQSQQNPPASKTPKGQTATQPPQDRTARPDHPKPTSDARARSAPDSSPRRDSHLAIVSFRRGRELLDHHQFTQAAHEFRQAISMDATNPLYWYLLAMAEYAMNGHETAQQFVTTAAELERKYPLDDWGSVMQRYQGTPRLWLEKARRSALKQTAPTTPAS